MQNNCQINQESICIVRQNYQKNPIIFVTRIFRNWRPSPRESDASEAKSVKHRLEITRKEVETSALDRCSRPWFIQLDIRSCPKLWARQPSVGDAAVPSLERKLSEDVISADAEVNREVSPVNGNRRQDVGWRSFFFRFLD